MRFFEIQTVKAKSRVDKSQTELCLKEENYMLRAQNFVVEELESETNQPRKLKLRAVFLCFFLFQL